MLGFGKKKRIGRLGPVRSFAIYYGPSGAEAKSRLTEADLAIVELRQWRPEDIADIGAAGARIFGYLSVMETPDWDGKRAAAVDPADIVAADDGSPVRFAEWKSVLMDLRSPRYRSLLLAELDEMAQTYRIDGVFLDTVGDIEDYVPEPLRPEMTEAYRSMLAVAKGRFPGLKWIQNRGFMQADPCSRLLDGFLWEGFDAGSLSTGWSMQRLAGLKRLQKQGLTILTVSDRTEPHHRKAAERHGFIHWTSPKGGYNGL